MYMCMYTYIVEILCLQASPDKVHSNITQNFVRYSVSSPKLDAYSKDKLWFVPAGWGRSLQHRSSQRCSHRYSMSGNVPGVLLIDSIQTSPRDSFILRSFIYCIGRNSRFFQYLREKAGETCRPIVTGTPKTASTSSLRQGMDVTDTPLQVYRCRK